MEERSAFIRAYEDKLEALTPVQFCHDLLVFELFVLEPASAGEQCDP